MDVLRNNNAKKRNDHFLDHPIKAWQGEYLAPANVFKGKCPTFQNTMKLTVIIGQWFGLNPVLGITNGDTSKLRFKFFSLRSFYSVMSILGQFLFVFFCFLKLIKYTDASLSSNTSIVFYGSNFLTSVLFYRIATKWPRLCQHIAKMEAVDPNMDAKLAKKCNVSCIAILSLALVEHLLSDLSGVAGAIDCANGYSVYETFVKAAFSWVFSFVPYNNFMALLTQFINIQCTFNWNFSGVFVICISIYLTSRLEQINKRIDAVKGKFVPSTFWRAMREDYCRTTALVRKVNDVIGGIIFISFANNLFFICLQLLHTLKNKMRFLPLTIFTVSYSEGIKASPSCHTDIEDKRPLLGYEQAVYFVYSFVFLMGRSLAVSLIAAQVHTASKQPAYALYEVSSETYCVEVQRFLDQIHTDTVALSGIQFFYVKRGLVLTIAGTIVTYELVLMQFTGVTPTSPSLT